MAVGRADGSAPLEVERLAIDPQQGAAGILRQIQHAGCGLLQRHRVTRIGIGFGGPVDVAAGRVLKSHQIAGWDGFRLVDWCHSQLGVAACVDNDCNMAALAEARLGAGQGQRVVFYVTVGTGVGGGLVVDGQVFGADRPAVAELGHLRPGLDSKAPEATVESLASGWGIAAGVCRRLRGSPAAGPLQVGAAASRAAASRADGVQAAAAADLVARCGGDVESLTARIVAEAAAQGNPLAQEALQLATRVLGWAIAQAITLVVPQVVVIGGGVSQISRRWFFEPLEAEVQRYVFPPLLGSYRLVPTALGELVVVHGAMVLAKSKDES